MKVTRFVPSAEGGSRFTEWDLATDIVRTTEGGTAKLSRPVAANSLFLAELSDGRTEDWHPAPSRQLIAILQGTIEIETTDGTKRQTHAGELLFGDDCGTTGHRMRAVDGPARVLMIQIPPDIEP